MTKTNHNTAVAVRETAESTALVMRIATAMKTTPVSAKRAIALYGQEIVEAGLEIKADNLTMAFYAIAKIVEMGLTPVEAKTLYLTRAEIVGYAKDNGYHHSVSLHQLARLTEKFHDFRESDEDGQFELIENILSVFGWENSFRKTVDAIVEKADELHFTQLKDLLDVNEDLARGDIHRDYFPDRVDDDGEDF